MMTLGDLKRTVDRAIDMGLDPDGYVQVLRVTEVRVRSGNDDDVLASQHRWVGIGETMTGERLFLLPAKGE